MVAILESGVSTEEFDNRRGVFLTPTSKYRIANKLTMTLPLIALFLRAPPQQPVFDSIENGTER